MRISHSTTAQLLWHMPHILLAHVRAYDKRFFVWSNWINTSSVLATSAQYVITTTTAVRKACAWAQLDAVRLYLQCCSNKCRLASCNYKQTNVHIDMCVYAYIHLYTNTCNDSDATAHRIFCQVAMLTVKSGVKSHLDFSLCSIHPYDRITITLHAHYVHFATDAPACPSESGFPYPRAVALRSLGASSCRWLAFHSSMFLSFRLRFSFLLFLSITFVGPLALTTHTSYFRIVIQCFSVFSSIWQDDFIFFLWRHFVRNELWLHHVNGEAFPMFSFFYFPFFHFQPCSTCRYWYRRSLRKAKVICFRN